MQKQEQIMMRYKIIFQKIFKKVSKTGSFRSKLLASYIKHKPENTNDPRNHGKALVDDKKVCGDTGAEIIG